MKLVKKQENNADLKILRPRRQKIQVKIRLPLTYEEELFGFFKRYAEENRLSFNGLLAPYLTKVGIHGFMTARSCRLTTKTSNALIEFAKSKGWTPPDDTPLDYKIVEAQEVCDDFGRLIERYGMDAVKNGLNKLDSFLFEQCLRSKQDGYHKPQSALEGKMKEIIIGDESINSTLQVRLRESLIEGVLMGAEEYVSGDEWDDTRTVVYTHESFTALIGQSFPQLIDDSSFDPDYVVLLYPDGYRYRYILAGIEATVDSDGTIDCGDVEVLGNLKVDQDCDIDFEDIEAIIDGLANPTQQSFSIDIPPRFDFNQDFIEIYVEYADWPEDDDDDEDITEHEYHFNVRKLGTDKWETFVVNHKASDNY